MSLFREGPACARAPPYLVLSGERKKGEAGLIGGFDGAGLSTHYEGIGLLILAVLGVYAGKTYVECWHACSCSISTQCFASSWFYLSQFSHLQCSFQTPGGTLKSSVYGLCQLGHSSPVTPVCAGCRHLQQRPLEVSQDPSSKASII